MGGDLLLREKSRNVRRIAGLLIKCNSVAESPNLVQQTGPYSASLLISCSVTLVDNEFVPFQLRDQPELLSGNHYHRCELAKSHIVPIGLADPHNGLRLQRYHR
jgi:hypothetical protein